MARIDSGTSIVDRTSLGILHPSLAVVGTAYFVGIPTIGFVRLQIVVGLRLMLLQNLIG